MTLDHATRTCDIPPSRRNARIVCTGGMDVVDNRGTAKVQSTSALPLEVIARIDSYLYRYSYAHLNLTSTCMAVWEALDGSLKLTATDLEAIVQKIFVLNEVDAENNSKKAQHKNANPASPRTKEARHHTHMSPDDDDDGVTGNNWSAVERYLYFFTRVRHLFLCGDLPDTPVTSGSPDCCSSQKLKYRQYRYHRGRRNTDSAAEVRQSDKSCRRSKSELSCMDSSETPNDMQGYIRQPIGASQRGCTNFMFRMMLNGKFSLFANAFQDELRQLAECFGGLPVRSQHATRHCTSSTSSLQSLCVAGACRPNCIDPLTLQFLRLIMRDTADTTGNSDTTGITHIGTTKPQSCQECSESTLQSVHFWSLHLPETTPPLVLRRAVTSLHCNDYTDSHKLRIPGVRHAYFDLYRFESEIRSYDGKYLHHIGSGGQAIDYSSLMRSTNADSLSTVSFKLESSGIDVSSVLKGLSVSRRASSTIVPLEAIFLDGVDLSELSDCLDACPPTRHLFLCLTNYFNPGVTTIKKSISSFLRTHSKRGSLLPVPEIPPAQMPVCAMQTVPSTNNHWYGLLQTASAKNLLKRSLTNELQLLLTSELPKRDFLNCRIPHYNHKRTSMTDSPKVHRPTSQLHLQLQGDTPPDDEDDDVIDNSTPPTLLDNNNENNNNNNNDNIIDNLPSSRQITRRSSCPGGSMQFTGGQCTGGQCTGGQCTDGMRDRRVTGDDSLRSVGVLETFALNCLLVDLDGFKSQLLPVFRKFQYERCDGNIEASRRDGGEVGDDDEGMDCHWNDRWCNDRFVNHLFVDGDDDEGSCDSTNGPSTGCWNILESCTHVTKTSKAQQIFKRHQKKGFRHALAVMRRSALRDTSL